MKRLTLGEFINKATNIHGDKYNYLLSVYVNAKTKLIVTCNIVTGKQIGRAHV